MESEGMDVRASMNDAFQEKNLVLPFQVKE
jgi:hypothetical protein